MNALPYNMKLNKYLYKSIKTIDRLARKSSSKFDCSRIEGLHRSGSIGHVHMRNFDGYLLVAVLKSSLTSIGRETDPVVITLVINVELRVHGGDVRLLSLHLEVSIIVRSGLSQKIVNRN